MLGAADGHASEHRRRQSAVSERQSGTESIRGGVPHEYRLGGDDREPVRHNQAGSRAIRGDASRGTGQHHCASGLRDDTTAEGRTWHLVTTPCQ